MADKYTDRTRSVVTRFPLAGPFRLVLDRGTPAERVIELSDETVRIGSGAQADVRLKDPHLSRLHSSVRVHGNGVQVDDLNSRNGTFVNGVRVTSVHVSEPVTLVLGTSHFAIEVGESRRGKEDFGDAVASSQVMRDVFTTLDRIATTELTLTLLGETGVGKDVLTRAVHAKSSRAKHAFVVFDCASVAPNLIESELFGHVKGAFTGAISERKGAFESAHGGTLFIDEVGELALELQPRLLRALEQRIVRRVGGNKDILVDVRVIAATNRDLEAEVRAGKFRSDLYYRLSAAIVRIPPLRERLDDLPKLVEAALREAGSKLRVGPSALEILRQHDWPGNVRELKNVVASAAAFAEGATLEGKHFSHLGKKSREATLDKLPLAGRTLEALESAAIRQTLERTGGNKTRAADVLGIATSTLYEKLKKYGL